MQLTHRTKKLCDRPATEGFRQGGRDGRCRRDLDRGACWPPQEALERGLEREPNCGGTRWRCDPQCGDQQGLSSRACSRCGREAEHGAFAQTKPSTGPALNYRALWTKCPRAHTYDGRPTTCRRARRDAPPRGGPCASTKARTASPSGCRCAFVQAGDDHGAARGHVPLATRGSDHPRVSVLRGAGDHGPAVLRSSCAGRLPTGYRTQAAACLNGGPKPGILWDIVAEQDGTATLAQRTWHSRAGHGPWIRTGLTYLEHIQNRSSRAA